LNGDSDAISVTVDYTDWFPTSFHLGPSSSASFGDDSVGVSYWAGIWKRVLSQAEADSLYANPWQIFAPQEIPIFLPQTGLPYSIKVPWTRQPPHVVHKFDTANQFGKHVLQATVPGWFGGDRWESVGQKHVFKQADAGTGPASTENYVISQYGPGIGSARAYHFDPTDNNNFSRFANTDGPVEFPDLQNFSMLCIYKFNEKTGASDERIYSRDTGYNLADHDFALTHVGSTPELVRCRVRRVTGGTVDVQTDAAGAAEVGQVNVIWGGQVGGQPYVGGYQPEDNTSDETTLGSGLDDYDPRATSMTQGFGGTMQDNDNNASDIDLILQVAFDYPIREDEVKLFMQNIWQIFEPQRIPIFPPLAAVAGGVVITDVDGDEAWNDGDTGLIITGTGFV
jgi:hypothetical protein